MRNLNLPAAVLLCFSMVLCVPVRAADNSAPPKTDQEQIEGSWKVIKKVKNGVPEDVQSDPATLTFLGETVTAITGKDNQHSEGTFAIDQSKSPRWITLTGNSGPHAGTTFAAIYELSGDTLKLAYSTGKNNATRPEGFTGKQGEALEVFERVKP